MRPSSGKTGVAPDREIAPMVDPMEVGECLDRTVLDASGGIQAYGWFRSAGGTRAVTP